MPAPITPDPGDELGPVDFLAIEFPGARISAPGFEQLLSLADQGVIDILDLEFITKDSAGVVGSVDVSELSTPDGGPGPRVRPDARARQRPAGGSMSS